MWALGQGKPSAIIWKTEIIEKDTHYWSLHVHALMDTNTCPLIHLYPCEYGYLPISSTYMHQRQKGKQNNKEKEWKATCENLNNTTKKRKKEGKKKQRKEGRIYTDARLLLLADHKINFQLGRERAQNPDMQT